MKAFQLDTHGGPRALRLVELPEPRPSESEALIEVEAIGINYPDLLATLGQYQHRSDLPFVPGCEVAGTVVSAPNGSRWSAGDRIAAFTWEGGYAERAAVNPAGMMALPSGASPTVGAGMVVNYQTVHFALSRRGRLHVDETVLVMGAAGGIGTAAVQVGRGLGGRVIAGVADEQQADVAREAGAEEVVILTEGFATDVQHLSERGVNVVLDPLGGRFFDEAVRTLAPEGRILVVGFAAGEIPSLRMNRLLLRNASAIGVGWGAFLDIDSTITETAGQALSRLYEDGIVRPEIRATYSFKELPVALERLERGEIPGKAVVVVR